ncbi:hypothetical protein LTR84_012447 [Exophiala bonariae]|uniref:Uncharacterized protein n=1 Tax=Exophiala bonariae TaxID=1690606 RepID=A0AAV9MR77_9EURO|nr:hypothetical protein LTR84_012447 [Exophiala bonariae]
MAVTTTTPTPSVLLLRSCSLVMQLGVTGSPGLGSRADKYLGCLTDLWQAAETGKCANLVPRSSTVNVQQLAIDLQQLVHEILKEWNGTSSGDNWQEPNDDDQEEPKKKRPKSKGADQKKEKRTTQTQKPQTIDKKSLKLEGKACEGECTHGAQDILKALKKSAKEIGEIYRDVSFEDEVKKAINVDTDALMAMIQPPKMQPPKIAYSLASLYLYYDCQQWLAEMEGRSERAYARKWGLNHEGNVRTSLTIGYKMAVLENAAPGTGILPVHAKSKFRGLHQGGLPCLLAGMLTDAAFSSLVQLYSNEKAKETFWGWAIRRNTAKSELFKEKSKQLLERSISLEFQMIGHLLERRHQSTGQLTSRSSGRNSQDIAPRNAQRVDEATAEVHNLPTIEAVTDLNDMEPQPSKRPRLEAAEEITTATPATQTNDQIGGHTPECNSESPLDLVGLSGDTRISVTNGPDGPI